MIYKYDKKNREELKNILVNRYVIEQLTSNLDFYKQADISTTIKYALNICNDPDKELFNKCIDIVTDVLFNLKSNIVFASMPVKDIPTISIKNPKNLLREDYNSENNTIYIRSIRFDIGESSDIFNPNFANGQLKQVIIGNGDNLNFNTIQVDKNNLAERIIIILAISYNEYNYLNINVEKQ